MTSQETSKQVMMDIYHFFTGKKFLKRKLEEYENLKVEIEELKAKVG